MSLKLAITSLAAAGILVASAVSNPADAQRRRGSNTGAVATGAVIGFTAGAIAAGVAANNRPAYYAGPSYGYGPVVGVSCWRSERVWTNRGWRSQRVYVC